MDDQRLRYLTAVEREAVEEFLARLRERYGDRVVHVVLFGSKAQGGFDEESDIDLLVVVEEGDWHFRREVSVIGARVSLEYEANISPKAVTYSHYCEQQRFRSPFYENVLLQGMELWTKPPGTTLQRL